MIWVVIAFFAGFALATLIFKTGTGPRVIAGETKSTHTDVGQDVKKTIKFERNIIKTEIVMNDKKVVIPQSVNAHVKALLTEGEREKAVEFYSAEMKVDAQTAEQHVNILETILLETAEL